MADARSYRPGGGSAGTALAPSAAVNPAFVNPSSYDEYLLAAHSQALSPDDPAYGQNHQRLNDIVSANPGITPDAAIAAYHSGAPANSATAGQIAAMTVEQRAQAIASAVQNQAAQQRAQSDAGPVGFLKSLSRTTFNALEAPFQLITNAAAYGAGKANGTQPDGVGIGDVFTNTDIGNQMTGAVHGGGDTYLDQGDGWFADPNSQSLQMKSEMDSELAGGLAPTIGGRLADSLELPKGSTGHSILSGTVDAFTRVLDPSMYVGPGEVKAAVRAARGIDVAGDTANLVRAGATAAAADDTVKAAREQATTAIDHATAANREAERLTPLEQAMSEAHQQFHENVVPKAAEYRAASVAASQQADTLVGQHIATLAEDNLEGWRQRQLYADSQLKATTHELTTQLDQTSSEYHNAQSMRDTMLGEGHQLPEPPVKPGDLPPGYTLAKPEQVHVAPPLVKQATDGTAPWHGNPTIVPEPNLETATFNKQSVLDRNGNEVAVLYTDPETGVIEHVGTDPAHRRNGLAAHLLEQAQAHAAENGHAPIQHSSDVSELGQKWRDSVTARQTGQLDESAVTAEAAKRHADDLQAWEAQHGDAEATLLGMLSPLQKAEYHKTGLFPLSVIRKEFGGSTLGSASAEELSALIRSGSHDLEADYARHGASKPIGDWESEARYRPGKDKGQKFVTVPWKRTKADLADSLEGHADDVRAEAQAAHEARQAEAAANYVPTKVVPGDDTGSMPAVRSALEQVLPDLGNEYGVHLDTGILQASATPKEAVRLISDQLADAGVPATVQEQILYSLNDDLMQHGVVIDGVAGLAPAGRGRAIAQLHGDAVKYGDAFDETIRTLGVKTDVYKKLSANAQAAIKRLTDERPIQRAQSEAERLAAKGDEVEAGGLAATARRVASLQGRLDGVNARVAEHIRSRDEALAAVDVMTKAVAERAGKPAPIPGDTTGQLAFLNDVAGLRTTVDGTDVASIDRGLKFLLGTDSEPLYRAVAAIDNPARIQDMTRGKMPAAMVNELAAAKTIDEARSVFVRYVGRGMVDETTGQLRALRIAGRAALNGRDPDTMLSAYDKAFAGAAKAVDYGMGLGKRNVPWASSRHIEDHEGMVNLTSDTINYMDRLWRPGNGEGRAFHDEWVNKMLAATSSDARRTVWYQMLDATATRAATKQGLSEEATAQFVSSLKASMARQRNLTTYTAEARAANGGEQLTLNGQPLPKDIATLESEMSTRVMTPDWREMRRALKSAQSLEKAAGANPELRRAALEASDAIFDKFWRTSVLAFRGGYVLRNTADIAARMYLAGHPGLFTSPHGIAALALSHHLDPNSALGKLVNRAERANLDVDGGTFSKVPGEDGMLLEAVDHFNRVAGRNTSLLDPGSPGRAMRLGEVPVGVDHPLFYRGWANELGMMWSSPMGADVLKVMSGSPSKALRDHMKLTGITDRQDALVDYLTAGAGKARLDRLRDLSPTLGDKIKTADDLRAYLFGPEAVSLASRWRRLTLDLNPAIVKHAMGKGLEDAVPDGQAVKAATSFLERRDATAQILRGEAKDSIKDPTFPVQQVRAPVWADRSASSAFGQRAERATDAFFSYASHMEKELGYLPEFLYSKWDKAAQLVHALSPEDAATVLAAGEKALGGGLRGAWADRTLAQLRKGAKMAAGDGAFTVDDLKHVSGEYGVRRIKSLFYDAQARNAFGHATRLVSPFAQAWANSLRVWGRLALEKPQRVYAAAAAYQAGMGPGTAWLSDDPSNPDDALFYNDPQTGQASVGIPVAGSVLAAIGSLVSKAQGGDTIDPSLTKVASPVSSFNLLFQNGMLPGVGPVLQVPASMLDGSDKYQALVPDWAKQALVPYTNVDPNRDPGVLEAMTPGWLGTILAGAGVPGFQERVTKYVKPAMASLFSQHPDRYLNAQGFMDADAQAKLLRDANALAQGITFGKGILMNSSAGAVLPELLVKDRNGNSLSQVVLAKQFNDLTQATGSREQAMNSLIDRYGVGPLMTMLPNREFGYQPTDQAYQFVKSNPDVADAHGSVLSLFLPGGGYSAYMDRWTRERGSNPALSAGQIIDYSNGLLYEAASDQLDHKLVQGALTQDQYDTALATLKDQYKEVPQAQRTLNGRDVAVAEIKTALTAPVLGKTQAGHAADVYLRLRDQALASAGGGALSGKGDAPLRAWLRQQGEELALQYPDFLVMWTKVFRGEVKD